MYRKSPHSAYQAIQITTTDQGRLLLMLYEGCIKFLRQAKVGLENSDIVTFSTYLSKAQAIIAELMNTLDFENGGSIAKELERLYDFMLFHLTEANLQKDPSKIQKVIDLVDIIYSAFREIIEDRDNRKSETSNTVTYNNSNTQDRPTLGKVEFKL
jgi:flagellar secretion chaperone FliS